MLCLVLFFCGIASPTHTPGLRLSHYISCGRFQLVELSPETASAFSSFQRLLLLFDVRYSPHVSATQNLVRFFPGPLGFTDASALWLWRATDQVD